MKKLAILFVLVVLLVVLLYTGDYVVLRIRGARNTGYGSVIMRQYYAIGEKNS